MSSPFDMILTVSHLMQDVIRLASRAAETEASILILGETGTGKDLLAACIHEASLRSREKYVTVNCAAIPDTLIESELFGYRKGAFTDAKEDRIGKVEAADRGTLFLDEIGDLSLSAQSKLLRVVENGELQRLGEVTPVRVNTRIVAATNKNLKEAIRQGGFREDLFWRISEVVIKIPPLRERVEDIELLSKHFVKELNRQLKKNVQGISNTALSFLAKHAFPGNVRELKNMIRQSMILVDRDVVWLEDLPIDIRMGVSEETSPFPTLKEVEKEHIKKALVEANGNKTVAAKLLGLSRTTLYEKIREYDLILS